MAREQTSHDAKPQGRPPFNMDSLVAGGPDIVVVEGDEDIHKLGEDEKFMNEIVYIRFTPTNDQNAPKMVELACNTGGVTGPMTKDEETGELKPGVARGGKSVKRGFERGRIYPIPRFLVEVAAHAKIQTLEQSSHPSNPYEITQTVRDSFYYDFTITRDDNPKGVAWLQKIMADPA